MIRNTAKEDVREGRDIIGYGVDVGQKVSHKQVLSKMWHVRRKECMYESKEGKLCNRGILSVYVACTAMQSEPIEK